jgi:uncharacterized integral membrane protein (TIGR00698 family)
MDSSLSRHKNKVRGIIACILIALASKFLALNYGAPTMLFALILGMSVNFLSESEYSIPGIDFCSSTVLRFGVILLGSKILFGDVLALGWVTALVLVGCMFATILFGALIAKALKLDYRFGMLSGGAVGICGISAAMTLSSVMPKSKEVEHYTLLTVVMVATFGAIAMVVYPVLASFLDLNTEQMGIFIGGSIHDVSHVIGAGYSISEDVGYVAMIVKMLRVALLIPMAWIFLMIFAKQRAASEGRTKLSPPYFLLGFVLLAIVNNIGWIPEVAGEVMNQTSQDCFVVAIAALGMKTSFKGVLNIGWRPVAMVLSESLFLGGLVLAWVML